MKTEGQTEDTQDRNAPPNRDHALGSEAALSGLRAEWASRCGSGPGTHCSLPGRTSIGSDRQNLETSLARRLQHLPGLAKLRLAPPDGEGPEPQREDLPLTQQSFRPLAGLPLRPPAARPPCSLGEPPCPQAEGEGHWLCYLGRRSHRPVVTPATHRGFPRGFLQCALGRGTWEEGRGGGHWNPACPYAGWAAGGLQLFPWTYDTVVGE